MPVLLKITSSNFVLSYFSALDFPGGLHALWLSDHHIHSYILIRACQPDLLSQAEPHLRIDLDINVVGTLEVAWLPSTISLSTLAGMSL